LQELNAWLTKNTKVLPQTLGFKAEAVNVVGTWCASTVEEESNHYVMVSFDG